MLVMEHDIQVGRYKLGMVDSVKVKKSVETLSDTATIVLPGVYVNRALDIENKLHIGDGVTIKLGYLRDLQTEFKGYLKAIKTDDGSITLDCEDGLFQWRSPLKDVQLTNVNINALLQRVCSEVNQAKGTLFRVNCDYDFTYEKYTFYKANAIDVLKQIQDETKANIYFEDNVLHIHPPYSQIANITPVIYDFAVNVEKSDLKYVKASDKNVCVEVTFYNTKGEKKTITEGKKGGTKKQITVNNGDESSAKKVAESEYNIWCYDGYEGSLTGWLIPYVEPSYMVTIKDDDYPHKTGNYYVIATEVEFSSKGGSRKVTLGRKI